MAIDTENKRRSTLRLPWMPLVLPVPDSAIAAEDRAHIYVYHRSSRTALAITGVSGYVTIETDPLTLAGME